jgi:2-dehydro-3-deoxygluconokinase
MTKKVLCFGELLLRLSPELNREWITKASMPVFVGGAELNAATALANWGVPVAYATALPDNFLSKEVLEDLANKHIDVSPVALSGARIGTYYLPQGADLKNAGVIYDRAYSSFAELKPGDLDWNEIFNGIDWFHFSAISPALNPTAALVCKEAVEAASARNVFISVDLNYRAKLWQYGKKPIDVMPELAQHCDLVMGNIWAAQQMLGTNMPADLGDSKEAYLEQAQKTSAEVVQRFPKVKQVANTFRFKKETDLQYYATLFVDQQLFVSSEHHTSEVVDQVGSGDCFMAGLIYSNLRQNSPQEIIDFAAAAAFTKLFIKGDATTATVEDIHKQYMKYA